MTETDVSAPAEPTAAEPGVLGALVARLVLIVVATAVAFWESLTRTEIDALPGGMFGYLLMVPLLVLAMTIGITRRAHDELPIHDREIDAIVGGLAMALSLATLALLVPRYRDTFYLLRTDLMALILFVFGACVLLFGLRAASRYWAVWLALLVVSPLGYRVVVVAVGGTWVSVALVASVIAAIAVGIAVARTTRLAWVGFGATLALSMVLLVVQMAVGVPPLDGPVSARAAPVTAGTVVALTMLAMSVRRRDVNWSLRPARPSPVQRPWKASLLVVVTAAALAMTALPEDVSVPIGEGPPLLDGRGLQVPAGWSQTGLESFGWAGDYFGDDASLIRQTWTADEVNGDWDDKGRRRTVVVDSMLTLDPNSLLIYPGETLYSTIGGRRSPMVEVELGAGIVGRYYTIVDQNLFLTWTKLNFEWTRGDFVQAVNLIAVDNHEPGAEFPALDPEAVSVISQTVNVLLRGNAIEEDDDPEYKDADMLTTVGQAIVAGEWDGVTP